MSKQHRKLTSKANKKPEKVDKNESRRKHIVLDITISSDEDDSNVMEKLRNNADLCNTRISSQKKTDQIRGGNGSKGDNMKSNRRHRNRSQKEENTKLERESLSENTDSVLSQSDKTKIKTALKRGGLHRFGMTSAIEDSVQTSSGSSLVHLLGPGFDKDLNDTDDFSGGTTPYRAVITKNLLKQEQLKIENKLAKRSLKRKKTPQTTEPPSSPKSLIPDNSPVNAVKSKSEERKEDEETDEAKNVGLHYCQICQADITSYGVDERTGHVNSCIDKNGQQKSEADDKACNVCQICKKDLSRYNSQRKTQHINRCADELEERDKKQKEEQAALEKARNKVLDCPLCGQHLKTSNGRKTHMKKCALNYNVSVVVLQKRIKQQEEEYARDLENGILPLQPAAKQRRKIRSNDSTSTVARPDDEPMSKADADLQLAVALSESIHRENIESSHAPHTSQASNAFGVLMTPKVHKHTKRKTKIKPTPALLLANEDTVAIRLSERVAHLIVPPEYDEMSSTPQMPSSSISSIQAHSLWEKSVGENCNRKKYYVEALMPPLCETTIACGSKIRRLSTIPGRGDSSLLEESPDKNNKKEPTDLNNTTLIATTQTALLLAEMDEDQSIVNKTLDNSKNMSLTEQDLNATGFIFPEDDEIENKRSAVLSYTRLMNQQEQMINNKMLSDLSLETADGVLYAHKYQITLKCPTLFKHIEKVSRIDLKTYGKDVVIALLRFLYVDDTSPKDAIVEDLNTLAIRFGIQELANICCDNLERKVDNDDRNLSQKSAQDLNALLKKVWGSDEDTDETSDDDITTRKNEDENEREEAEIDAVYQYMASQRSSAHEQKEESSDEDLSEIDGDTRHGGKKRQENMVHNSQHSFLGGDILEELLLPSEEVFQESIQGSDNNALESGEDHMEDKQSIKNEDMNLHLTVSEPDEISEDDELIGSPLVIKLKKSMKLMTEISEVKPSDSNGNGTTTKVAIVENDYQETVLHAEPNKPKILVCERFPLSKEDLLNLADIRPGSNMTMTREDLHGIKEDFPDLLSWSVTICSKCSPCKEAEGVILTESDKEVMLKTTNRTLDLTSRSRKSSYETPVMSRTCPATTSVTPDLFDTSTATEEYSMNLSHWSVNSRSRKCSASTSLFKDDDMSENEEVTENSKRSRKGSSSTSILFNDYDISENCDIVTKDGAEKQDFRRTSLEGRKNSTDVEDIRDTECTHDGNEYFNESHRNLDCGYDDDDVVPLSQEEVEMLPKSRSPSPVFGSQQNTIIEDQYVVKEEKDESDNSEAGVTAPHEPDWLERDLGQSSNTPKKIYSFKSKKRHKPEKETLPETKEAITLTAVEPLEQVERCRSSLSLSQKRKKRRSSDDSHPCFTSNSHKRSRTKEDDHLSTEHHVTSLDDKAIDDTDEGLVKEKNQNNSSPHDEDAIDLTQEESPKYSENNSDLLGNYDVEDVYHEVDEIPWQDDDMDDGVLVMEESIRYSSNQSIVQSPVLHQYEDEEGVHNMSMVYDPPTDIDTDYSMLCNDSVLWNDENEPKVQRASQNMLKTPSAPVPKSRKKPLSEWVPPSPFTPMPPYESMDTPELKRHCKKYGIRPLPKKRMKTTLKTIHAETHTYETDSDFEQPSNESAEKIGVPTQKVQKSSKSSGTGQKGKKSKNKKETQIEEKEIPVKNNDSGDSGGTNDLDSSLDSLSDMLEESMMPGMMMSLDDDEDEVTPSQVSSSPKSKEQRVQENKIQKIADMKRYIRSNHELWGKILQYEVFEFDDLKDEFANAGIKIGNEALTNFLDETNIQFTLRNHQGGRQKKKGKTSPKKNGSPKKKGRGRPKAKT